jgi:hypothetical protein
MQDEANNEVEDMISTQAMERKGFDFMIVFVAGWKGRPAQSEMR